MNLVHAHKIISFLDIFNSNPLFSGKGFAPFYAPAEGRLADPDSSGNLGGANF
jgi:hypothetical protein